MEHFDGLCSPDDYRSVLDRARGLEASESSEEALAALLGMLDRTRINPRRVPAYDHGSGRLPCTRSALHCSSFPLS